MTKQTLLKKNIKNFVSASHLLVPNIMAILVGISTGLIAVGFIHLIHFLEDLFFGKGGEALTSIHPAFIVLIPAIGGLFVGPIVTFLAPEAKGHGVPQVLKAIILKGGRIRPVVALAKSVASALAIGSGASVGREGPIVQVGSALGSITGQVFKLSESRTKNMVACGAAAGIAAVFNAPIAGVMFSMEVILRDFGAKALSTVVISAVSSSIIAQIFLGESPAFIAPTYSLWSPFEIFIYLGLGIASALVAHMFMFVLHQSENTFDQWKFPNWLKPAVGGLILGCIGLYFPQVFGAGLSTIEDALHGNVELSLLLILILVKIVGTSVSLGSGSSGGVFAPALFIGAVLGGAVGKFIFHRMPFPVAPPGAYALVGMASVFAGAALAPVTAIMIVFEMTGDYRMILPIMVAVVSSTSLSQFMSRDSIYTVKLRQRGVNIGALDEVKVLGALLVQDAMSKEFEVVPDKMPAKELIEKMSQAKEKSFYLVNSKGDLKSAIKRKQLQAILLEDNLQMIIADDVAIPIVEYAFTDEPLSDAAKTMHQRHLTEIPVVDPADPDQIVGVLRSENIFEAYTDLSAQRNEIVERLEQDDINSSGTIPIHFAIPARSPLVGKKLKEIDLPEKVVLTSIKRGRRTIVPEGETTLKVKDKVWAVVVTEDEPIMRDWVKKYKLKIFD